MIDTFKTLLPILLVIVASFSMCSHVLFRSNISTLWKVIAVPISICGSIFVTFLIMFELGRAVPSPELPPDARILGHIILTDSSFKKKNIEVWVKNTNKRTRLYVIPYDESMELLLNMAQEARQKGFNAVIKKKKKGDQNNISPESEFTDGNLTLQLQAPEYLPPKQEVEENTR